MYLALEAVEESFMLRNYGNGKGYLYKPDSIDFGGRNERNSSNNRQSAPNNGFNMPIPKFGGAERRNSSPQSGFTFSPDVFSDSGVRSNGERKGNENPDSQSGGASFGGERMGFGGMPGMMGGGFGAVTDKWGEIPR